LKHFFSFIGEKKSRVLKKKKAVVVPRIRRLGKKKKKKKKQKQAQAIKKEKVSDTPSFIL
jgi:hypothetical protein